MPMGYPPELWSRGRRREVIVGILDADVRAEAKAMLREIILRSGWYPQLDPDLREQRIDRDVEEHWHLTAIDARLKLETREAGQANQ
jgi:hypothetical protein